MNEITLEQTKKIASLSCIRLSDTEIDEMQKALSSIMNLVDYITEVDTTNVEPLINPTGGYLTFVQDVADTHNTQKSVLRNAPKSKCNYFAVPKMIE